MDVLSDAVTAMRVGRAHSTRTNRAAPWGASFEPFGGAGFHVVLRGTCLLVPEGEAPITLGAGDVVLLPHGSGHGLSDARATSVDSAPEPLPALAPGEPAPGGASGEVTELLCGAYLTDRARLHPLMDELPPVMHLPARIGDHGPLRTTIDLLGAELARVRPGAGVVVPALLDTLLLYILRAWFEEQADHDVGGWATALNDPAISAALRAIHGEPARRWTVDDLGSRAGLSRAAFARRFGALTGRPPLAYLTWWRMIVAARLLRESDVPLRAVAERVGYSSEFAFANAFKREHGVAPGRFRRGAGLSSASL